MILRNDKSLFVWVIFMLVVLTVASRGVYRYGYGFLIIFFRLYVYNCHQSVLLIWKVSLSVCVKNLSLKQLKKRDSWQEDADWHVVIYIFIYIYTQIMPIRSKLAAVPKKPRLRVLYLWKACEKLAFVFQFQTHTCIHILMI